MLKENPFPYLISKVRDLKKYSGKRLVLRFSRIEKIISFETLNGNLNEEQLEELMMVGYVEAQKKIIDEYMTCQNLIDIERTQTIPDPHYKGDRIIKPDSDLGKMLGKFAEELKIMLDPPDQVKD